MSHLTFGTLKMWTTLGLVGLVLMLMASEATNSQNLQKRTSHTSRRVEYNNTQMLLKVNIGSNTLLRFTHQVHSCQYQSLCLIKENSKTFQNLVFLSPIFMKTQVCFFGFSFPLSFIFTPNEFHSLCSVTI